MATSNHTNGTLMCPPCDPSGPFTRNHFFTGKLLVERDFTDEQQYHVGKMRHHNARLHGSGVVCGLKVHQHPEPACRDRFVCISPGTAIDCCGRELVIRDLDSFGRSPETTDPICGELVDLEQFADVMALSDEQEPTNHVLRINICYKECGIEDIPVLFDECGCDDTRCAPNRLLESYEIRIDIDPEIEPEVPHAPALDWTTTAGVAGAVMAALDEAGNRLFVMTVDETADQSTVYEVATENHAIKSCTAFDGIALAMALSPDAQSLYIAAQAPGDAPGPRDLVVFDTADLSTAPSRTSMTDTDGSPITLATWSDQPDRVAALAGTAQRLQVWHRTGPDAITVAMEGDLDTGVDLAGLVIGSDGVTAHSVAPGSPNSKARRIDLTDLTNPALDPTPLAPDLPSDTPVDLAVVRSTGDDLLLVLGANNDRLYLVDPSNAPANAVVLEAANMDATHEPVAITTGPGGQWAYILVNDTNDGQSYVRVVNVHLMQQGQVVWTNPVLVGEDSRDVIVTSTGRTLYIPFNGNDTDDCDGGVAVIDVTDSGCCEIFWRHLDGCPPCEDECVVLATIENYRPGHRLHDQTDPPTDPQDDATALIARIDNRQGRTLLPSTQAIAEMLACLCARGESGEGAEGQQGPPGQDGDGIDDVIVNHIPCNDPVPASTYDPATRTLTIFVSDGCDGADGEDGDGITDVVVVHHPCEDDDPAPPPLPPPSFDPTTGVLTIHVRNGCDGADGLPGQPGLPGLPGAPGAPGDPGPGLEAGLTRITALSWTHNDDHLFDLSPGAGLVPVDIPELGAQFPGIVVGFTERVQGLKGLEGLTVFEVKAMLHHLQGQPTDDEQFRLGHVCWCNLVGAVALVTYETVGPAAPDVHLIERAKVLDPADTTSSPLGLAFILDPENPFHGRLLEGLTAILRIRLQCDFVLDEEGRAIDGEFARAQFLSGDRPKGSDFGIQGGIFESVFRLGRDFDGDQPGGVVIPIDGRRSPIVATDPRFERIGRLPLSDATPAELRDLPRIGRVIADRIIARRDAGALSNEDDLRAVEGINDALLSEIRHLIRFD